MHVTEALQIGSQIAASHTANVKKYEAAQALVVWGCFPNVAEQVAMEIAKAIHGSFAIDAGLYLVFL